MGGGTDLGRATVREFLEKPRSVRVYLVALSVALVVPLLFVSIWLMLGFVRSEMQAGRDRLARDATSLSADVDREISSLITLLDTLATSTSLKASDLATFHARASAALGPREAYVLLLDTTMQQLLNTRRPFGVELPRTSHEESAQIVLQTGETRISDSFVGAVSGQRVINVLRPVLQDGNVRYILIVTVNTDRFAPLLKSGKGRKEYAIALMDAKQQLMSTVVPDTVSQSELAALESAGAQEGLSERLIGSEVWLEASHVSELTGWHTVIRIPRATLDGPLWRSLYLLGLAALITVAAAAAVIAFVTRRVSTSIAAILDATRRLASGLPLPLTAPAVLEAFEIMIGLREASKLVEARTKHLRESEARYRSALRLGKMGSWETDFIQRKRNWSPEAMTLFDLRRSDGTVGGEDDELAAVMHPDDRHLLAHYHEHLLSHDELDAEYRIILRDGTVRHVSGRGLVISRQRDGSPHILINVAADVTERANAEEHLSEFANNLANSKARFEALVEATAQIVWSATPFGEIVEDSPSWRAFTGQSEEEFLGDGWLNAVHPDDRDRTYQAWVQAVKEQKLYQIDYRVLHVSGVYRWMRARGVPLKTASGTITEWVGMNEDVDDRVKRSEQLRIVSRELSHRTKNLLAVIQSIARRTFSEERSSSPRVQSFIERLQGLAVSHDLLVHGNWSGVSLEELVREHLKPFIDSQDSTVEIEGPHLNIEPAAAQNLGLALHELATNAAKYGALKTAGARLRISWSLERNEQGEVLNFHWREDVPLAGVPQGSNGFGSRLLDAIIGPSLGGSANYRVSDEGVEWRLMAPLDSISGRQ